MSDKTAKLSNLLDQWESSSEKNKTELSHKILEAAQYLINNQANSNIPSETWHRYLNITGSKDYISSLKNKEARYAWAESTTKAIYNSNYDLLDMFENQVSRQPAATLFQDMSGIEPALYSYDFIKRRIEAIAAAFYSLQKVPRVAIFSNNCVDGACCDLACLFYNIFVTPLNIHFDVETVAWIVNTLGINIIVTDNTEHYNRLLKVKAKAKTDLAIFTFDNVNNFSNDQPNLLHKEYIDLSVKNIKDILDNRPKRKITEVSTIMFTSGSTGKPKGVSFSNFNLVSKRFARAAALPNVGDNEILLCYLPLFHTFGRYFEMMGMIYWGGTYVFPGNPSIETLLQLFTKINPTGLIGVPVRWTQIEERCGNKMSTQSPSDENIAVFRSIVGKRLHWGLSAAGYLSPKVFKFFNNFGVKLCSGFGMTEATGGITMTPPDDYKENSIGIPLPCVNTRLTEENELLISGPYIGRYLDEKGIGDEIPFVTNPDNEHWLSTGDLFTELDNGHLGIIDRLKDIYKNNKGQTIAPRKVEQIFENVPDIKRTFLVGDAKDYNVLLIIPNHDDPVIKEIESQDSLRDYYHHIVTNANRDLPPYERIINYGILDRDFDIEKEELTPKGSYRRKIIEKNFTESIEKLYQSNNVEYEMFGFTLSIPRWFFRDLGILEDEVVMRDNGLYNPNNSKFLRITETNQPNRIIIGDLIYQIDGKIINLGILVRQPRLWLGNKNLIEFHPCKVGWDTTHSHFVGGLLLPDKSIRFKYNSAELNKQLNVGQELESANKLIISALNGSKEIAVEAVKKLGALLKTTDERLANVIRRRLESLATHEEFEIRSLAYTILLIDEPTPSYDEALPAFIESGLPFLDKNSISEIAKSSMNKKRLASLRQRLYNYRTKLGWPASEIRRQQLINILELLVDFSNHHPVYYDTVRSELASWILHTSDPILSEAAEREFTGLYKKYESRLSENSPEISEEHWDSLLVFGEELTKIEITRIKEILIGTTFLKQSIVLAFDDRLFEIDQIQPNGIWISRIISRRKYLRYRLSINTRTGKHYDLQVIISEDVNDPEVLKTIYWLMSISSYPYGHRVLPRLGCCRPELGVRSLVYKGDLTAWERIRELSSLRLCLSTSPRPQALKKLIVRGLAVIFRGWILSGRRITPGLISLENIMVPDQDFMEDSIIQSLSGWQICENKMSLIKPMIRNFIKKTASHYPWTREMLKDKWVFDSCVEEMGPEGASLFLSELKDEIRDELYPDDENDLYDKIDKYLEFLKTTYYIPIRVQNAISRYEGWAEVNPNAIPLAKQQSVEELLRLYRFDRLPEIARYHLYRHTYFMDMAQGVLDAFDNLLQMMFNKPKLPAIKMIELTSLQEAIVDLEDRKVFGNLIFPMAGKPHQMDLLTVGDSEHKLVIMQTSVTDKLGETHIFREPIEPSEIGQLYRLFFKEGYSKTVNESDKFLVVVDSYGQIIGGLCYRFEGDGVVLLDGSVVAAPFMGRGIGSALVEDFCNRMANQKIRIIKTHFFLRRFYLKRGFQVDQRWGALVKFLKPIDYEN